MIIGHAFARLASLLGTAHTLHVHLPREVEILVKGNTVPVHGFGGCVTGLASRALAPRTVHPLMDESALAMARPAPLLPVCSLSGPGCGLLTATRIVGCARALGHDDCARIHLAVVRPGVTDRGHTGPAASLVTAVPFLLTVCSHERVVSGLGGVTGIA